MEKWEDLIKYIFILAISLFIEYFVLGPFIQQFVEMGAKDLTDPYLLYLYKSMFHIIDIIGVYSMISSILRKFGII